ncbi:MAG: manganese efflux pump [Chloroflexi bacterium]|nr:manganese efflux pump [Chloroflexota bacterium]
MIAAFVLFLSLGLDTLAVSVGLGLSGLPRSRWLRVGLTFALFEGLMPILGLLVGKGLSEKLGEIAAYAAAVSLIGVGLLAVREALTEDNNSAEDDLVEKTRGNRLLLTGLSVSLDELAVGFSLGVLQVSVGVALIYIAIQAFALTFIGVSFGGRLGAHLGERAELASGVVLALLGVALLVGEVTGLTFF